MKASYVLTIFIGLAMAGCGGAAQENTPFDQVPLETAPQVFSTHSAQNSLDWNGVYHGQLPCADCAGIDTQLTLHSDQTYTLEETYLGESEAVFSSSGRFQWNKHGNTITLDNSVGAANQYFVAENQLWKLDMHGDKIEGDLAEKYILTKQ